MAASVDVGDSKLGDHDFLGILKLAEALKSTDHHQEKTSTLQRWVENTNKLLVTKSEYRDQCHSVYPLFLAIETITDTAIIPPFERRENYSYDKSDFRSYPVLTEAVIDTLYMLITKLSQFTIRSSNELQSNETIVSQCNSVTGYFTWLIPAMPKIFIILGAHLECKLWSSSNIEKKCRALIQLLLTAFEYGSVQELMCSKQAMNLESELHNKIKFQNTSVHLQTDDCLFRRVFRYCESPLAKQNWQQNPFIAEAFIWIVKQFESPLLSDHIDQIVAIALNFLDDHQVTNKIKGVRLVHHLLLNTSSEEMRWYNRAQVIYESLKHQLYSKEAYFVQELLACLVCILKVLETFSPDCEMSCHHDVYEALLRDALGENLLAMRRVYIVCLGELTQQIGIGCVRHLKLLVRLVEQYLSVADGPKEDTQFNTLILLHAVIIVAWPRIPQHAEAVTQSLCKFLIDLNMPSLSSSRLRDSEAVQKMNGLAASIFTLLMQVCPELDRTLQTLGSHSQFISIKPIIDMALKS